MNCMRVMGCVREPHTHTHTAGSVACSPPQRNIKHLPRPDLTPPSTMCPLLHHGSQRWVVLTAGYDLPAFRWHDYLSNYSGTHAAALLETFNIYSTRAILASTIILIFFISSIFIMFYEPFTWVLLLQSGKYVLASPKDIHLFSVTCWSEQVMQNIEKSIFCFFIVAAH